jgi:hypothetical protein
VRVKRFTDLEMVISLIIVLLIIIFVTVVSKNNACEEISNTEKANNIHKDITVITSTVNDGHDYVYFINTNNGYFTCLHASECEECNPKNEPY